MIETIHATFRRAKPSSVEADARAMDHRAHVAGPPPLRQPVPVITAAPSVEVLEHRLDRDGPRWMGIDKWLKSHESCWIGID